MLLKIIQFCSLALIYAAGLLVLAAGFSEGGEEEQPRSGEHEEVSPVRDERLPEFIERLVDFYAREGSQRFVAELQREKPVALRRGEHSRRSDPFERRSYYDEEDRRAYAKDGSWLMFDMVRVVYGKISEKGEDNRWGNAWCDWSAYAPEAYEVSASEAARMEKSIRELATAPDTPDDIRELIGNILKEGDTWRQITSELKAVQGKKTAKEASHKIAPLVELLSHHKMYLRINELQERYRDPTAFPRAHWRAAAVWPVKPPSNEASRECLRWALVPLNLTRKWSRMLYRLSCAEYNNSRVRYEMMRPLFSHIRQWRLALLVPLRNEYEMIMKRLLKEKDYEVEELSDIAGQLYRILYDDRYSML